ncbi:MAG: DUF559 domain-containing protein [Xanthomonadaceae bacterium]|nr:DUF559 domain-containing protein [Xanthomonadaceae bacterium]
MTDRLLSLARSMRREPTDAEARLWQHLRAGRMAGVRFGRQVPIGPYVVDFVCQERRIIIEADGSQHADAVAYDQARADWLAAQGYSVLRFWNHDILARTESVLEAIHAALKR